MIPHTVTPAMLPAYIEACRNGRRRSRFTLLTTAHEPLRSLEPLALDGQIDIQKGSEVRRVLTSGFYDPDTALGFDSSAPTQGFAGLGVLIQVYQDVLVDQTWHATPMGVFRPSTPTREGSRVTVEAQDKASWHLRGVPVSHIEKNVNKVEAIRAGLLATGETRLRFPASGTYKGVTQTRIAVGGPDEEAQPWRVWSRLATDEGLQLFYDGEGYATLRPLPAADTARAVTVFDAHWLTESPPTKSTDLTTLRNRLIASGSGKARFDRTLPAYSEVSPQALAINGVPWANIGFEQVELTKKKLDPWASKRLTELSQQDVRVEFDSIPAPWVEPDDWCLLNLDGWRQGFSLANCTIPLGPEGTMSVGYNDHRRSLGTGLVGAR